VVHHGDVFAEDSVIRTGDIAAAAYASLDEKNLHRCPLFALSVVLNQVIILEIGDFTYTIHRKKDEQES
jgi:hypothetical protein